MIKKSLFRNWQLKPNFFIAHLPILVLFKTKGGVIAVCTLLDGTVTLKGLSQDGGRADFF
jgi:hypothetical protein